MFFKAATLVLALAASLPLVASTCTRSYTVKSGDTCDGISASQSVSSYQLAANNPSINAGCTNLAIGQVLCLGTQGQDCDDTLVVEDGDTCDDLISCAGINFTIFWHNNPTINSGCTNLYIGQVVCVASQVVAPAMGVSEPAPASSVAPPPAAASIHASSAAPVNVAPSPSVHSSAPSSTPTDDDVLMSETIECQLFYWCHIFIIIKTIQRLRYVQGNINHQRVLGTINNPERFEVTLLNCSLCPSPCTIPRFHDRIVTAIVLTDKEIIRVQRYIYSLISTAQGVYHSSSTCRPHYPLISLNLSKTLNLVGNQRRQPHVPAQALIGTSHECRLALSESTAHHLVYDLAYVPKQILLLHSTIQTGSKAGPSGAGGRRIKLSQALSSSSYLLGLFAPPEMFTLFHPRPTPPPPPENSEEANRITARIEKELNELEVLRKCREAPDASEWYEARPYVSIPPERLANHFTGGVIRGPTKIAVPPLVRSRKDETETWVFLHLGTGICGHEGIIHGGLLATLLDEGCARPAFLSFPSRVAVTANLNLNFRAPTKADQFVIMKTKLVELKGRKAVVDGRIEDLDGKVLVEARGIFVEPKLAAQLYHTGIPAVYPSLRRNLEQMAGAHANPNAGQPGNANDAQVGVETEVKYVLYPWARDVSIEVILD
ncbi:hypothetical protein Clacol_007280 [Clathrus columnatus]|uniref:LysM domain-containing protein n=1 Tax=Clathrus columnatus TaxID=1419009 RepID=A0AAV5AJB4_9AGAM|nr:hypothetical protein Clacol_007280 [Clathrus columnatus]